MLRLGPAPRAPDRAPARAPSPNTCVGAFEPEYRAAAMPLYSPERRRASVNQSVEFLNGYPPACRTITQWAIKNQCRVIKPPHWFAIASK